MDNNNNISLPSDWVKRKLIKLQWELETSGKWPEPANQLSLDLIQSKQALEKEADSHMFSVVVNDALNGIDITKRYPLYYRRMLQTPELFQAFLDVIEVLESEEDELLEIIQTIKPVVPEFISVDTRPVVERPTSGGWLVRWRQSVAQLNTIFTRLGPDLVPDFRSSRSLLEESVAQLIRGEVLVDGKNFGVVLSAVLADDPDAMSLQLTVALLDEDGSEFPMTSLEAGIHWGGYDQVQALNDLGQAVFPPLLIKAITDETGETINNDLQLLIHPTN